MVSSTHSREKDACQRRRHRRKLRSSSREGDSFLLPQSTKRSAESRVNHCRRRIALDPIVKMGIPSSSTLPLNHRGIRYSDRHPKQKSGRTKIKQPRCLRRPEEIVFPLRCFGSTCKRHLSLPFHQRVRGITWSRCAVSGRKRKDTRDGESPSRPTPGADVKAVGRGASTDCFDAVR